jgi:ketosteroid isomerase-like protein
VDVVRGVFDEWAKGNFRVGEELWDESALMVQGKNFPEAGSFVGREEIRGYTLRFLDSWQEISLEAEELESHGDTVLVTVLQRGKGRESGVPGEFRYWQLWSFRGNRVIRFETFRERSDALAAVTR